MLSLSFSEKERESEAKFSINVVGLVRYREAVKPVLSFSFSVGVSKKKSKT